MGRKRRKQHKIINAIVKRVTVDMMDNFCRFKIPTKMLFHYKAMFSNISRFSNKRVVGFKNKKITMNYFFTAIPIKVFIPSYFTFASYSKTFLRTIFRTISFYSRWVCSKFISTNNTTYQQRNSFCLSYFRLPITFHRTVFSVSFADMVRQGRKYFTAYYTSSF